jgi:DNA-binding response OmpR family regulator
MKARILLVDDDESVLAALTGLLESEGYEVAHAANGHEGLRLFHDQHVDLALLDINMPVKNGWETLDQIVSINPLLPVIIITARPDAREKSRTLPLAAFMQKPLDPPALLANIERLLAEPSEARYQRAFRQNPLTSA